MYIPKNYFPMVMWLLILLGLVSLQGCAYGLSVPGGDETTNRGFYKNDEEFLQTLECLKPGMSEEQVFEILKRKPEELVTLDRAEILKTLYGGSDAELQQGAQDQARDNHFLQSLKGYKFVYKNVEREHGFTSPIRIRTDESGYAYTVYLIFRDGILFENPTLSGGVVNNTCSKTVFDYLTPSTIVKHTVE